MDFYHIFSISFSPLALIFLCTGLLSAIAGVFFGLRPLWTVARRLPSVYANQASDKPLPKISVIVYAPSWLETIPKYLEELLRQDYPDFEVIVVFSASAEATATLTEELAAATNLSFTFIPPGSLNLSRRKLALTIGMKAAKGDVAVFTSSNCHIPSCRWLSEMAAPFRNPEVALSLGYCHHDFSELSSAGRRFRTMDATLTDCSWIDRALAGKPFRGDAANMAIRRDTFFANKGFARTISLHCGEDDLFVREIARPGNTAVAISADSILSSSWGPSADKALRTRKAQWDFTRYYLPQGPFRLAGFASMTQWITIFCLAAGALSGLPSLLPATAALVILAAFWWLETTLYIHAARRLGLPALRLSLPFLMLWRPVGNFIFRLRHRSRRYSNFTWNRHGSRK